MKKKAPSSSDGYVTTRELAAELKSMRWEFRFLIAAVGLANMGLAKVLGLPGTSQATSLARHVINHLS
jgi:hypothetical protein